MSVKVLLRNNIFHGAILFHNLCHHILDYLIYFWTFVLLSALLFSGYMIEILFPADLIEKRISNSLPLIISLTILCLMFYMNTFLLKKRGQSFALYMLSGYTKKKICFFYILENITVSILACMIGIIAGLFLFFGISIFFDNSWNFRILFSISIKTFCHYISVSFFSLFFILFHIIRLNIKDLIYKKHFNETKNITKGKLFFFSISFLLSFCIYFYQIYHFNLYTIATISITIGIIIYTGYSCIFCWIQWYRGKHGFLLYQYNLFYIIGEFLSQICSFIKLYTIISICFLLSIASFVTANVFFNSNGFFMQELDSIMGFIQYYISILFLIILFSILALRQIVDTKEQQRKFVILNQLGMNQKMLHHLLFLQVFLHFGLPIFMALFLIGISLYSLFINLYSFLPEPYLLIFSIINYLFIFLFISISYIMITYTSLRKTFSF